jgi:plastocyanin
VGELRMIAPIVVLMSTLTLSAAGCASNLADPAGPGPAASSAPSPGVQPLEGSQQTSAQTISVQISNGKVTGAPDEVEVNRGDRVRIEVTSDSSDQVHVHGYDKTVELVPGKPGTVEFVADVAGVFEVETHESGLLLFQLGVRG